ncbi:MAG: hypothetical protein HWE20_02195 [Gammaproteobacteria bacterium]|nr:hypothetical protein [Gammaproteobacteria bacterium]
MLNNIVPITTGIIGASAWLAPLVYKKLTKPELKGRAISHFVNEGQFNSEQCLMYFLALNVISLNRCFNIKNIDISVQYKSAPDTYNGKLFWARKNKWTGPNNEQLKLEIQAEDALLFVGTIPQDVTKKIYITFRVDKAKLEEFEKIVIVFTEESGHKSTVEINKQSIDGDQMLWDDRIWIDISPNQVNSADAKKQRG